MGTITTRSEATSSTDEARQKLHDIIDGTRTVMLLSHGEDGKIVGRPMALQRIDEHQVIYFAAGIEQKKVEELRRDPRVSIAVQNREGFAMVDGEATISQDRALIEDLWEDDWNVWYEGGKSDPSIAIIVVRPLEGTFWSQALGDGLSYLWRYAKARVTGHAMDIKADDQQTVDLRTRP
ncbi:MAG: pyridoxamine 5'-phosphate oxidase family protein [Myxococcota bacterium]|nr:pyridoxamine 5'-phosphate oxidase family protein [Myxococcota bacterium]